MYKLSYSSLHKFGGSKTKCVMVLVAIAFQANEQVLCSGCTADW